MVFLGQVLYCISLVYYKLDVTGLFFTQVESATHHPLLNQAATKPLLTSLLNQCSSKQYLLLKQHFKTTRFFYQLLKISFNFNVLLIKNRLYIFVFMFCCKHSLFVALLCNVVERVGSLIMVAMIVSSHLIMVRVMQ